MKKISCVLVTLLLIILNISQTISGRIYRYVEVEGSTIVLSCRVSGIPVPKISWSRDGVEVHGGRFEILPSGDLKIERVSFGDGGRYKCRAEYDLETKWVNARLEIKQRTRIIKGPEDQEVGVGKDVTFLCRDIHDSMWLEPKIEWLKDNSPIDFANQPRFLKLNDNSLAISKVTELDAGEYTCVVGTKLNEQVKASGTLKVIQGVNTPHSGAAHIE